MLTAKGLRIFLSDRESIMSLNQENYMIQNDFKKYILAVAWWTMKLEAKKLFRKVAIFQARCICKSN